MLPDFICTEWDARYVVSFYVSMFDMCLWRMLWTLVSTFSFFPTLGWLQTLLSNLQLNFIMLDVKRGMLALLCEFSVRILLSSLLSNFNCLGWKQDIQSLYVTHICCLFWVDITDSITLFVTKYFMLGRKQERHKIFIKGIQHLKK